MANYLFHSGNVTYILCHLKLILFKTSFWIYANVGERGIFGNWDRDFEPDIFVYTCRPMFTVFVLRIPIAFLRCLRPVD